MNLRKDHYRSFTRTLRTFVVSFSLSVGVAKARLRIEEHPASADHPVRAASRQRASTPRGARSDASSHTKKITQLLSVDILA